MGQQAFGLSSLYDPQIAADEQELMRRQRIADLLRMQSMAPMGGTEMAGRVAIRKSPLEGVAKVFQAYMANKSDQDLLAKRGELTEKQARAMAASVDNLFGTSGQPANVPTPQSIRPEGVTREAMQAGGFPQPQDVAPAPVNNEVEDMKRRAKAALLMGNKELANKLLANLWEQTPEMKNMTAKGMDPKAVGKAEMARLAREGERVMSADQVLLGADGQPTYTAPSAPSSQGKMVADLLRGAGIDAASPQGQAFYRAQLVKEGSHPNPTTVSVNTEKGYAGNIAEGLAKQDLAVIDAGRKAPDRVANARNIKSLLDQNPITGKFAEQRIALNQIFSQAGMIDGKQVADSQVLGSQLAQSTLDAIKSSGLGAGNGFSNADREFLALAKGGKIDLDAGALRRIADLNEKAAIADANKANAVIKKLKKNPNMGGVGGDLDEVPVQTAAKGLVQNPDGSWSYNP